MDLFPDSKDFQPTNHIDLDRDSSLWDDFITQQVKKVVKAKPVSIVIAWQQKDAKSGFAIGSVIVKSTQSDTRFNIPVIIKDFKLAPLDAAMTPDGHIMSFNEDSVEDLLFDGNLARDTANKPKQPYDDLIPGAYGGETSVKYASVMAHIHDTIDEKDWARVQKEMTNPAILYKFSGEKSVFVELFKQKLTKKEPEREVEVVKKIGPNAYVMMSNSLENFDPALEIVSSGRVIDFINKNIPEEYRGEFVQNMQNDGVIVDWSGKKDGVYMVDDSKNQGVVSVTDPGFYRVRGPNGDVDGMYIKALYEPVADRKASTPVFISGDGGGPQQGKVKGIPITDVQLPIREVRVGDFGYFLYIYENEPVLVGPYTVKSVGAKGGPDEPVSLNGEDTSITALTDGGEQIKIQFSDYASGFSVFDPKDDSYEKQYRKEFEKKRTKELTIPSKNCAWVPCNDLWQAGKMKEEVVKEASVRLCTRESGGYEFKGLDLDSKLRYPEDKFDAAFVLRCCGASMEKIASIMKEVDRKGQVWLHAELPRAQKKAAAKHDLSFVPKDKLTKIASLFEDMTTVDAVLSLNFINNDNIAKFTSALPQFEKVREELLRLLITSRLGNIELSENTLKQAIDVMDKVIKGLHTLKARV